MPVNRRGASLVELIVALALAALVAGSVARVFLLQTRSYRELVQRAGLADNLRAGADILAADLWSLDATDGDILALGPDSLRIRGERRFGVVCAVTPGAGVVTVTLRDTLTFGVRDFRPGDSLLAYVPGDSEWVAGAVASTTSPAQCPDSAAGERLAATFPAPGPVPGVPIRGYEIVTYRSYRAADGSYYLGLRDAGGLQPLAGPLTADGLRLSYFDAAGAETATATQVQAVRIALRVVSAEPVVRRGRTAVLVDSVALWLALRNNRRPGPP